MDLREGDIFCDRLTLRATLDLIGIRVRQTSAARDVFLLDGGGRGPIGALLRALGYTLHTPQFFAGHLRMADGESVRIAAKRITGDVAVDVASSAVDSTPLLNRMNARWRRQTIRLHIAKIFRDDIEPVVLRILVAQALARSGGTVPSRVVLHYRGRVGVRVLTRALERCGLTARLCRGARVSISSSRFAGVAWEAHQLTAERAAGETGQGDASVPGVLLFEEDDLSLDRSYRTQPHFLTPGAPLPFRLLVLERSNVDRALIDPSTLAMHKVFRVPEASVKAAWRKRTRHAPIVELRRNAWLCAVTALVALSTTRAAALAAAARLCGRAARLGAYCHRSNVRAFMTCENYYPDADAMQLVSEALPVPTFGYQYANQPFALLGMMTTASSMLTFAPRYQPCWTMSDMAPGRFVDVGYPFDGAFALVAERARQWRRQLQSAGAAFVVCYFDESVQSDRYGYIHEDDQEAEIAALLDWVLSDPAMGLVVKVQFRRNSPGRRNALANRLEQARASGRFLELLHGVHRNNVFPAEAAMASDIAIGHGIGGTASLEAALAGVRSVIVNSLGVRTIHDDVYARGRIIFPSFEEAIDAIKRFRDGDAQWASLGDWSGIISEFDRFRDGQSAARLSQHLEVAVRA